MEEAWRCLDVCSEVALHLPDPRDFVAFVAALGNAHARAATLESAGFMARWIMLMTNEQRRPFLALGHQIMRRFAADDAEAVELFRGLCRYVAFVNDEDDDDDNGGAPNERHDESEGLRQADEALQGGGAAALLRKGAVSGRVRFMWACAERGLPRAAAMPRFCRCVARRGTGGPAKWPRDGRCAADRAKSSSPSPREEEAASHTTSTNVMQRSSIE